MTRQAEKAMGAKKKEGKKRTDLVFGSKGQPFAVVDHSWPGSLQLLARRSQFFDRVLALAELPNPEELQTIFEISRRENLPSIWRRAHPSVLENNATALISALAFSGHEGWIDLIRKFLAAYGLEVNLRGRPKMKPKECTDFVRGLEIDRAKSRLEAAFQVKMLAKRKGGFNSDDEEINATLKMQGYNDVERKALKMAVTLQDAACRYYLEINPKKLNIKLKGIQNSYARYKHIVQRITSQTSTKKLSQNSQ